MAELSTQPYKGARDFYPADMRLERYIFGIWRTVVERFGYEEYTAPLIELTDLYRAKTGEEIVDEQAYNFTDRGGREVTIRPEMTPSLARMVAAQYQELAYPLRWYAVPNCWRYERPQKGRLREHWQLNVDLLGVAGIEAELEIIRIADNIMRAFGATDEQFSIRLNSRKLMSLLLGEHLGLDVSKAHLISKLVDRKTKMSEPAFMAQVQSIMGEDSDKLLNLLSIDSFEGLPTSVVESGVVEELRQLFEQLNNFGLKNIKFDLTLMRGLDYYTGIVFEVYDQNPDNKRALFGGGRYDELTTIFDVPSVPAVGFGMGDVTIHDFLATHQLLPKLDSETKAYVIVVGDYLAEAQHLASSLRKSGVNVAVDITGRKPEAQLKTAIKDNIPFAIFIGEKEVKTSLYQLKQLATQKEQTLSLDKIAQALK